jgi:ATP-dependent helicase/nuclease subunit A
LPGGQVRRANLLKLHERAIQFEGFASSAGLALLRRFVEFIEKLEAAGEQWASAEPDSSVENAVRIISVHKSKGLEFPVVFLAELDSRFNTKDIYADVLADADYTLGLQVIDRKSNTKLSSLVHQIIAEEKLGTLLAEEMRILYVATTRVRERLVLSACDKRNHCRDIISNGFLLGAEAVADWQLRRCRGPLEWILYALCDQKGLHEAFETGLADKGDGEDLFGVELYGQAELEELSRYILKLKRGKAGRAGSAAKGSKPKKGESKLLSAVKGSLAWQYRFTNAPFLPAKQSVTELSHRDDEYVRMDYSKALQRRPKAVVSGGLAQVVEPRLVGTATHLVISGLDLGAPVTAEAIEKTKERLLADGAITGAVAERINCGSIMGFFESELGCTVLDSRNSIWREWPFTFAVPAEQSCGDETIIVQGIIDMLVRGPEGLLVIDFKTDNISAGEVGERAELYREQLELYGRAAEVILKEKVLGKWLYFLWPGCAAEVR